MSFFPRPLSQDVSRHGLHVGAECSGLSVKPYVDGFRDRDAKVFERCAHGTNEKLDQLKRPDMKFIESLIASEPSGLCRACGFDRMDEFANRVTIFFPPSQTHVSMRGIVDAAVREICIAESSALCSVPHQTTLSNGGQNEGTDSRPLARNSCRFSQNPGISQVRPINVRSNVFRAYRSSRLAFERDHYGFAEPLLGRYSFAEVPQ